jgi:ubiquinone/menaquinone biosynthesis C-methylase UbiE
MKYSDIPFPANPKYQSQNIINKWLIRGFFASIMDLLSIISPPKNIIDTGCGEGVVLFYLRDLFPSSNIVSLDVEMDLLNIANQINPGMQLVNGSLYSLPFMEQSYDMVLCTEVLEHLYNPAAAMNEIVRVGRKYFLFSVPHEPWWRIANMTRFSYIKQWGNTPGHVNHWTESSFVKFLTSYMEIISIRKPFPWIMILCQK